MSNEASRPMYSAWTGEQQTFSAHSSSHSRTLG
jgi:hypothetical protein